MGVFLLAPLFAQTHTAVQLDDQVYHILEQAEIRGLCAPLSGARPYTRGVVAAAINEILNSDNAQSLRGAEREILEQYLEKFTKPKSGIDWQRGAFFGEAAPGKGGTVFSADAGLGADIEGSAGLYPSSGERYFGAEIWIRAYLEGDMGDHFSYGLSAEGGLMKVPRKELGEGNTYYAGFDLGPDSEYQNQTINVYSEPLAHFPYSYKKRWDGSVFFLDELSSLEYWPESVAGGYGLQSELTASFLDSRLFFRFGRLSREWGMTPLGSSLAFNRMARPFLGVEAEFNPFPWFGMASLTGVLEYYNTKGEKESSAGSQNAFSATMLQFRYRNYLYFDFIDSVVWPKRFELGYLFPIVNNFFYQNNIGDFDNMAMTFNLRAQYPGLGNIWLSLFLDEMKVDTHWWDLDRTMIAVQAGAGVPLPIFAFSSVKISYTMVNPYCYTHNRNINPWYGDTLMETAYTNNGAGLGYYLPPNSDELLFNFKTMPLQNLVAHLQYQMIRHGADYGSGEVDGSSLLSELDPHDRDGSNPVLKRFFLHDGTYRWTHIVRIGADWKIPGIPVSLYGEAGAVISYFTSTEEKANSGEAYPYSVIDTAEYPKSAGIIVKIGVRVYPR